MIPKLHLFADKPHRRFKEPPVNGHRPVFAHPAADGLAKMLMKIARRTSQTLAVRGKPGKRRLARGAVDPLVIALLHPKMKIPVELLQALRLIIG